nr:retrotransposon protein, putative, Ty1-copia subclass [Tanacetum cinerariifolium]
MTGGQPQEDRELTPRGGQKAKMTGGQPQEDRELTPSKTVVKNILKYLRNTKDMFLVYGGNMKRELRVSCYTDAGYLTDADNLNTQTGYVFVLNGGAVD